MGIKYFYMVYAEGLESDFCKFDTLELAEKEARSLAGRTGEKAIILCSIKSYESKIFYITDMIPKPSPF